MSSLTNSKSITVKEWKVMVSKPLRMYFREPTVDTNAPITTGQVKIDGFSLEVVDDLELADAWDCGFAARMQAVEAGEELVSIPAFPNRKFRQSYIFVNTAAGIDSATDLEGRRVGIMNWANTAGVWVRGALQNYYGLDLRKIKWFAGKIDDTRLPDGLELTRAPTRDLNSMLLEGKLDAVIDPNVLPSITARDPRVRRLFVDYRTEEQEYFRKTGIFPISHVVTFRKAFVESHPEAPMALLKAFRSARDIAIDNIQGSDPQVLVVSWITALLEDQRRLMGEDFFSYNVARNRVPLEAIARFALEQGLISKPVSIDSLFAPETLADQGV